MILASSCKRQLLLVKVYMKPATTCAPAAMRTHSNTDFAALSNTGLCHDTSAMAMHALYHVHVPHPAV
jgi:hypothetical protein